MMARPVFVGNQDDLAQFMQLATSPVRSEQRERELRAWEEYKLTRHITDARSKGGRFAKPGLLSRFNRVIDLRGAWLDGICVGTADMRGVLLDGASLRGAWLKGAHFENASMRRVDFSPLEEQGIPGGFAWGNARLIFADFTGADMQGAILKGASLAGVNLRDTCLDDADLRDVDLSEASLVRTNLCGANLSGSRVYGISSWDVELCSDNDMRRNLVITRNPDPPIFVDNLEVAQFIYLLLRNEKIRDVIDTIGKKAVLILGRFTPKRKTALDAIREELRRRNYLPILFDFEKPASRDLTETISTLAHMARFIIADLTAPSSLPKELEAIVPTLAVPVQPVMEGATRPYAMFPDYWKYSWVLKVYRYKNLEGLIAALGDEVIAPAEGKVQELEATRKAIAEELLKQRTV